MATKTKTRASPAAMAALCVLLALTLSAMPGKAAASKFCECYRPCYTECRKTVSWGWRFTCFGRCLNDCSPHKLLDAGGDACARACGVNGVEEGICNSLEPAGPAPDRDATAACVRGCNRWRHHVTK